MASVTPNGSALAHPGPYGSHHLTRGSSCGPGRYRASTFRTGDTPGPGPSGRLIP